MIFMEQCLSQELAAKNKKSKALKSSTFSCLKESKEALLSPKQDKDLKLF